MKALLHTWTDEIDGRTFSVCESDHVTPCQREILNLRRQRDALAKALELALPFLDAVRTQRAKAALRAAGRLS